MCLSSYHKTPRIATSDIICYKVVYKAGLLNRLFRKFDYISPIYIFKWKINELYYQKLGEPEFVEHGIFAIGTGFHASFSENDVYRSSKNMVLVKCIIPKGTNYFSSNKYIVAEQMMIVEEIE